MVANSRLRFFAMGMTPGSGLEQRLHAAEVLVQFGSGIRPEQLGDCLTGAPGWREIAESQIDSGSAVARAESDDPGILQHRARLAPPRDHFVRGLLGHAGMPLDRNAAR